MSTSGKPITGYAQTFTPEKVIERDTTTCGHCQRVVFVKPGTACTVYLIFDRASWSWKEEAGAFCRQCMRPVCLAHRCLDHCLVWEKQLEASEARDRLRRAVTG